MGQAGNCGIPVSLLFPKQLYSPLGRVCAELIAPFHYLTHSIPMHVGILAATVSIEHHAHEDSVEILLVPVS